MNETRVGRELLTVAQACWHLQCSRTTLYRKIHSGELEAYRIGGSGALRIPFDAIECGLLRPALGSGPTAPAGAATAQR